jgi:hypothetical protein
MIENNFSLQHSTAHDFAHLTASAASANSRPDLVERIMGIKESRQDPRHEASYATVTPGGTVVIDVAWLARRLKANGVLDSARKYMRFHPVGVLRSEPSDQASLGTSDAPDR